MNNFGLDPGFSIVVIQGTLFFTIGVAMMLLSILATLAALAIARHRRPATAQALPPESAPPPHPKLVQEIYVDAEGFCLLGGEWEWLADQESNYGCPC